MNEQPNKCGTEMGKWPTGEHSATRRTCQTCNEERKQKTACSGGLVLYGFLKNPHQVFWYLKAGFFQQKTW
ncbi:hypothetical protein [Acidovorax radicis]|jgi:hypothetical protein|uniref:hypothetical protein n=1 Tax=Acidovorax radicis TaxID=758826 RepID=UPI001CF8AF1C|nr:hypothetical protein [Acidovorax radicis]UCU97794.1 hypothetical protein KI609_14635 [Acidovorax radicis]